MFTAKLPSSLLPGVETRPAAVEHAEPRYERKLVAEGLARPEIEAILRVNHGLFRPIYAGRHVNNIYLDDPTRSSYRQTVEGVMNRMKIRIRWYGPLFGRVAAPRLEFKIKHGLTGRKELIALPAFDFAAEWPPDWTDAIAARLPEPYRLRLQWVEPALVNRYYRTYYLSADRRFRITVDTDLTFHGASPRGLDPLRRAVDTGRSIVEIKYAVEDAADADRIAGAFPFRISRYSKYANGLDFVGLR
ncbi:MAG: VTC domain-containing protein [Rhodothermales bacterium]